VSADQRQPSSSLLEELVQLLRRSRSDGLESMMRSRQSHLLGPGRAGYEQQHGEGTCEVADLQQQTAMFEPRRDVVRKCLDVGLHFVGPVFLSLALIRERLGVRLPTQVAPQLAQDHGSRGPSVGRPAPPNHRRDRQSGGGGQQRQPYPAGLARDAEVVGRDGRVGRRRLGTCPLYSSRACLSESVHMIQ
jgi:hypothetical protein